jgi:hypothetical protein
MVAPAQYNDLTCGIGLTLMVDPVKKSYPNDLIVPIVARCEHIFDRRNVEVWSNAGFHNARLPASFMLFRDAILHDPDTEHTANSDSCPLCRAKYKDLDFEPMQEKAQEIQNYVLGRLRDPNSVATNGNIPEDEIHVYLAHHSELWETPIVAGYLQNTHAARPAMEQELADSRIKAFYDLMSTFFLQLFATGFDAVCFTGIAMCFLELNPLMLFTYGAIETGAETILKYLIEDPELAGWARPIAICISLIILSMLVLEGTEAMVWTLVLLSFFKELILVIPFRILGIFVGALRRALTPDAGNAPANAVQVAQIRARMAAHPVLPIPVPAPEVD